MNDGTEEQLKYCAKILTDLHKKSVAHIASHFYFPVGTLALPVLKLLLTYFYYRSYRNGHPAVCKDDQGAYGYVYYEEEAG